MRFSHKVKVGVVVVATSIIGGCGSVEKVRKSIDGEQPIAAHALSTPMHIQEAPRVREMQGTMLTASELSVARDGGAWLKSIHVGIDAARPISLTQAVAQLAAKGVNISSDLPLDGVMFSGTINQTDAESALRQLLGSTGLDYRVDDIRKLVIIKPLASRTWYLNLGNRRSSYASSGAMDAGGGAQSNSTSTSSSSSQPSTGGASGVSSGQSTGASGQSSSGQGQTSAPQSSSSAGAAGTGVSSSEDFWAALATELGNRLTVLVPATMGKKSSLDMQQSQAFVPALQAMQGMPVQQAFNQIPPVNGMQGIQSNADAGQIYTKKQIGAYSLNPETGAISVQAPHWVLSDLDIYLKRVQQMYNTDLTFVGELVLVSNTDAQSEGFDIQSFAKFVGGRYGALISNSPLGGVTVNFPNGSIPSVNAGSQTVGGALLGVQSAKDGLQIFNSYLAQMGKFAIKQRPVITTTSGVPGQFSTLTPMYYNTVSQTAAAGNTGAATQATTNTLSQKNFGTTLKVYPRFDMATGLVRAQISVANVIFAGNQSVQQLVSAGNGVQAVTQTIPLEKFFNVSGEALLRDGDLIIVGGQAETTLQSAENGLPIGETPVGGIFGTKTSTNAGGTYYFALQVSVKKR